MSDRDFLGVGATFPFRFDGAGAVAVSDGDAPDHDKIKESIRHILSTRPGERFFLPGFGSRLHELVFQQNDVVLKALARQYIVDAVKRWEKRVKVTKVEFSEDPETIEQNRFLIRITYQVIGSQVEGNLVYPFAREV